MFHEIEYHTGSVFYDTVIAPPLSGGRNLPISHPCLLQNLSSSVSNTVHLSTHLHRTLHHFSFSPLEYYQLTKPQTHHHVAWFQRTDLNRLTSRLYSRPKNVRPTVRSLHSQRWCWWCWWCRREPRTTWRSWKPEDCSYSSGWFTSSPFSLFPLVTSSFEAHREFLLLLSPCGERHFGLPRTSGAKQQSCARSSIVNFYLFFIRCFYTSISPCEEGSSTPMLSCGLAQRTMRSRTGLGMFAMDPVSCMAF